MAHRPKRLRRYTEDDFRSAVADPEVRTIADLCRRLGIVPRGGNYESLRAFADRLEVDLSHLTTSGPPLRFSDQELAEAAEGATSVSEIVGRLGGTATQRECRQVVARLHRLNLAVPRTQQQHRGRSYSADDLRRVVADESVDSWRKVCLALGLQPRRVTYERLLRFAGEQGIHGMPVLQTRRSGRPAREPIDIHELRQAVADSVSLAQVIRRLGLSLGGRTYQLVKDAIKAHDVDASHFTGQGWRKGDPTPIRSRRPLEQVLREGELVSSSVLRQRLIEEGVKEARCEDCGATTWKGSPVPLELEHVNGRRRDNRLDNLRLLCPNCHAFTATYRGRNIGRGGGNGKGV